MLLCSPSPSAWIARSIWPSERGRRQHHARPGSAEERAARALSRSLPRSHISEITFAPALAHIARPEDLVRSARRGGMRRITMNKGRRIAVAGLGAMTPAFIATDQVQARSPDATVIAPDLTCAAIITLDQEATNRALHALYPL